METNNISSTEYKPAGSTKELFKTAVIYGLMLAGAMMLIDLLTYTFDLTGLGMLFGILIALLTLAVYIGFFIWGGRTYRDKFNGGYINYGKAFLFCLLMALVSLIVLTLYYYLFYFIFDSQRVADEYNFARGIIETNEYMSEEMKEKYIMGLPDTAGKAVVGKIPSTALSSIIFAAIAALFVRKKVKITEVY